MKLFKLFPMLMIVLSLTFLPACADEPEAEVVPPVGEEVVEPEFGEEAELDEETGLLEPAVEGDVTGFDERFSTLEGYGLEERELFENELGTLINDYDARLNELEAQAAGLDETQRATFDQEINVLRQQRDAFQQQYNDLQAASDEEWENMRSGIMTSIEDYERSFEEAEDMGG